MGVEEKNCLGINSNNLIKSDKKAIADAYIQFKSSRDYELKRSKFKGIDASYALSVTKTDRIVINNELCQYINLASLCEVELDRSQDSSHLEDKQTSNVSGKTVFENVIATMVVAAIFFLTQNVLGDFVALVISFAVVMGYLVCSLGIAIK